MELPILLNEVFVIVVLVEMKGRSIHTTRDGLLCWLVRANSQVVPRTALERWYRLEDGILALVEMAPVGWFAIHYPLITDQLNSGKSSPIWLFSPLNQYADIKEELLWNTYHLELCSKLPNYHSEDPS